ncbi:hypothetical protein [Wolbachia endosymbiont of Ctenocephalides felis wCfeJ]|uniref:hypothetical protein n=1 Tax=Wolbachia endosymbiont of Ctenocephalides felis wCfeJ TaxID=2732594 RepID=UPI001447A23C|nr:hypothetical protein [Wolbachia endosymbiont of Ctenocephalides felis wCfeJ]WCR57537.1 MAG: hypothetical protein PG980_000009 [Wolbachia endosymbiont of Ctenocephalides felis wCfeJ]
MLKVSVLTLVYKQKLKTPKPIFVRVDVTNELISVSLRLGHRLDPAPWAGWTLER